MTRRMPLAWGVLRKDKGDEVSFVWEIDDPGGSISVRGNSQYILGGHSAQYRFLGNCRTGGHTTIYIGNVEYGVWGFWM